MSKKCRFSLSAASVSLLQFAVLFTLLLFTACTAGTAKKEEETRRYLDALDLYTRGDFDGALSQIRQRPAAGKVFFPALLLEAKILFFSDKTDESRKKFAALIKEYPQCTEARLWLVRCALAAGQFERAETLLDEELLFNPSDWRPYYLYSLCAAAAENYEKRLFMLNRAETHLGDAAKVYAEQAKIRFALGQNSRAREYVQQAQTLGGGLFAESFFNLEGLIAAASPSSGEKKAGKTNPTGGSDENQ